MSGIVEIVKDPAWWMTAVIVSLVIGVVANFEPHGRWRRLLHQPRPITPA